MTNMTENCTQAQIFYGNRPHDFINYPLLNSNEISILRNNIIINHRSYVESQQIMQRLQETIATGEASITMLNERLNDTNNLVQNLIELDHLKTKLVFENISLTKIKDRMKNIVSTMTHDAKYIAKYDSCLEENGEVWNRFNCRNHTGVFVDMDRVQSYIVFAAIKSKHYSQSCNVKLKAPDGTIKIIPYKYLSNNLLHVETPDALAEYRFVNDSTIRFKQSIEDQLLHIVFEYTQYAQKLKNANNWITMHNDKFTDAINTLNTIKKPHIIDSVKAIRTNYYSKMHYDQYCERYQYKMNMLLETAMHIINRLITPMQHETIYYHAFNVIMHDLYQINECSQYYAIKLILDEYKLADGPNNQDNPNDQVILYEFDPPSNKCTRQITKLKRGELIDYLSRHIRKLKQLDCIAWV